MESMTDPELLDFLPQLVQVGELLSMCGAPLLNEAHTVLHLFSHSFISASQPATSAEQ